MPKYDVFISYAHSDNEPERPGTEGWVTAFRSQLEVRLLKVSGFKRSVWWDTRGITQSQKFDPVIEEALNESKIILCLLSQSYLRSDYCAKELEVFLEKAKNEPWGVEPEHRHRAIPVFLYKLLRTDVPSHLGDRVGFRFYEDVDEKVSKPWAFTPGAFDDELWKLASEINALLNLLTTPEPARSENGDAYRIFLAAAADSVRSTRRRLAKGLAQDPTVEILPEIPPPAEAEPHTLALQKQLASAQLSVHLLGSRTGEPIDGASGRTFPTEQLRIATKSSVPQLILVPRHLQVEDIDDVDYRTFVKGLLDGTHAGGHAEVVRAGDDQMLEAILARKERAVEDAANSVSSSDSVFLDMHMSDLMHAADLLAHLAKRGVATWAIPSNLPPIRRMELFADYMKVASLFIIVFGLVDREWVVNRLTDAHKLVLEQGLATRIGVFLAPPVKPERQTVFPHDVMDNTRRFDPESVDGFIQRRATGP